MLDNQPRPIFSTDAIIASQSAIIMAEELSAADLAAAGVAESAASVLASTEANATAARHARNARIRVMSRVRSEASTRARPALREAEQAERESTTMQYRAATRAHAVAVSAKEHIVIQADALMTLLYDIQTISSGSADQLMNIANRLNQDEDFETILDLKEAAEEMAAITVTTRAMLAGTETISRQTKIVKEATEGIVNEERSAMNMALLSSSNSPSDSSSEDDE